MYPRIKKDALVFFDDPALKQKVAINRFIHFCTMPSDLHPWKWDEGIWSTNKPFPDASLFGQGICMYAQAVPGKACNEAKSLVESDSYYLVWQCTDCASRNQVKMARRPLTFLGAGLLERETWTGYGQPTLSIPNKSAAEMKEMQEE
jgi:hypothetical protein